MIIIWISISLAHDGFQAVHKQSQSTDSFFNEQSIDQLDKSNPPQSIVDMILSLGSPVGIRQMMALVTI